MSRELCYRCCHCDALFGESEALCENWMDPTRSFICPVCNTHLLRPELLGQAADRMTPRESAAVLLRWLPLGLLALLLSTLLERTLGTDAALVALVLMIPLALWYQQRYPPPPRPLRTFLAELH